MHIYSNLKRFLIVFFVVLLVSGCRGQNSIYPTETHKKLKETATLVQSTSANTSVPNLLFTPTYTTIPPIRTASPLTKTPTTVTKTYEDKWESPNRLWAARKETIIQGKEIKVNLVVESEWGNLKWPVEDAVYTDKPGIGYASPVPFYWSRNGQYMYFTHQSSGDGCYGGSKFKTEGLSRLDLSNGKISAVFPDFSSWMAISPDEKYLAYFVYTEKGITLRNVASGKEDVFNMLVKQEEGGRLLDQSDIVWSPDSKSLLYTVLSGACDMPPYSTWIIRVDVINRTQKIILENDIRGFKTFSWIENDQALVRDNDGKIWLLNLTTGEAINPR